jgi:hypothetical protein
VLRRLIRGLFITALLVAAPIVSGWVVFNEARYR